MLIEKKSWGALKDLWVPHDIRDAVIDFVNYWSERTDIPAIKFIVCLGIVPSKFYDWKRRYGKVNGHNSWIPRDSWLEDWGKLNVFQRSHYFLCSSFFGRNNKNKTPS